MDIKIAENEFIKYVNKFDTKNFNIKRKIDHSLRLMVISMKIAESLELDKKEVELATLIGLLHDIGRFEQFTQYGTYNDRKSIDHGELGVEVLNRDNYIREFIKEDIYDEIIKKSIINHNQFKIEDGLTDKEELSCKIVRDADKLDILYQRTFIIFDEEKEEIENAEIYQEDIKPLLEKRPVNRVKDFKQEKRINHVITDLGFVFDMNFKITFKMLKEKDYINKFLNRYDFKNLQTKEIMKKARNIVNEYVEIKQKG